MNKKTYRYCWIIGSCDHGNLGDHHIFESIKEFLRDIDKDIIIQEIALSEYYDKKKYLISSIDKDDVIIFEGGGHLGNLWPRGDEVRRDAFRQWPDNIKIVFPQSTYFSNDEEGRKVLAESRALYKGDKVIFALRDKVSYEFAKKHFKCRLFLTPDIVFYSKKTLKKSQREGIIVNFRKDKEKYISDADVENIKEYIKEKYEAYNELSNVRPYNIGIYKRKEELRSFLNDISSSKLVITDRLHAMIFCAITGTPCIVFGSNTHKISASTKWVGDLEYIKYAEDFDSFKTIIDQMNLDDNYIYPLKDKRALFDEFKSVVENSLIKSNIKPHNKTAISIIVPVYNVQRYLSQCLDSLLNQDLENIEIICVNDGSTDNSLNVLKKYQLKDKRIKIVNQKNRGLSASRNIGTIKAKGQYIMYLDSDDYLVDNSLRQLYEKAISRNLDILFYDIESFCDENNKNAKELVIAQNKYYHQIGRYNEVYSGEEIMEMLINNDDYLPSACRYIISKDLIENHKISFIEGILHEDHAFTFNVLLHANRVSKMNEKIYKRRIRANSIMQTKKTFENVYGYYVGYKDMLMQSLVKYNINEIPRYLINVIDIVRFNAYRIWRYLSEEEHLKANKLKDKESFYQSIYDYGLKYNREIEINKKINNYEDAVNRMKSDIDDYQDTIKRLTKENEQTNKKLDENKNKLNSVYEELTRNNNRLQNTFGENKKLRDRISRLIADNKIVGEKYYNLYKENIKLKRK